MAEKKRSLLEIWRSFFKLTAKGLNRPILWLGILLIIAIGFLSNTISLELPKYTGEIFKLQNPEAGVDLLFITKMMVILIVGGVIADVVKTFLQNLVTGKIDQILQVFMWRHLSRTPMKLIDTVGANELVSRTAQDTTLISQAVVFALAGILPLIYATWKGFKMLYDIHKTLFLLVFILIPIYVIVSVLYGRWSFRANRSVQGRLARVTRYLSELMFNLPFIKSTNMETEEKQRGKKTIHELYRADLSKGFLDWFQVPLNSLMDLLLMVIVMGIGLVYVGRGELDIDSWMVFSLYCSLITGFLFGYMDFFVQIKAAQGATSRISELLEVQSEVMDQGIEPVEGELRFENVSFAYDEELVLKNVSFSVKPGEKLVILGGSGSGKSTLMNLLLRLYTPKEGVITQAGQNIQDLKLREYRNMFSMVLQDSPVLSDTVRENILYGLNRPVTEDELREACRKAQALEFIEEMPDGFDSHVGVNGSKLSGGQRQRLALARCFLKEAPILIYDEPTASLDNITEMLVENAINDTESEAIRIVISHDITQALTADRVLILEAGEVVGEGTAEDVRQCEAFRQFVTDHMDGEEGVIYG